MRSTCSCSARTWATHRPPSHNMLTTIPARYRRRHCRSSQLPSRPHMSRRITRVCVDPPRVTALTLPAGCCAVSPAADVGRQAAAIEGTDGRTDGRTLDRYIEPAPLEAGSVNECEIKQMSLAVFLQASIFITQICSSQSRDHVPPTHHVTAT